MKVEGDHQIGFQKWRGTIPPPLLVVVPLDTDIIIKDMLYVIFCEVSFLKFRFGGVNFSAFLQLIKIIMIRF